MNLLKKYFKVIHEIYEYFDYSGGEKIYPIEDYTDFEWIKTNKYVSYHCEGDIDFITDEFINEYTGDDFTMFLIKDSLNVDNCLIIFDNKKYVGEDDYRN
jgi:hypothetical protein